MQTPVLIWSVSHCIATLLIDERLRLGIDMDALQEFMEQGLFEGIGRKSLDALWWRLQE